MKRGSLKLIVVVCLLLGSMSCSTHIPIRLKSPERFNLQAYPVNVFDCYDDPVVGAVCKVKEREILLRDEGWKNWQEMILKLPVWEK